MTALVLAWSLLVYMAGQQSFVPSVSEQSPEERVSQIIKTLEPDNTLRRSLESGARGDGVHHAWMDKMQQLGVRQASFTIRFVRRSGVESLKITDVKVLQRYYRVDTEIKDQKLLRQIRDSGLEKDLREAILVRARKAVSQLLKKVAQTDQGRPLRARGTLYLNLLDHKVLPILDAMPDVEW